MELLALTLVLLVAILTTIAPRPASGYKPVVFMHGLFAGKSEVDHFIWWLNQTHSDTRIYVIDMYDILLSLAPIPRQIDHIGRKLEPIFEIEKQGVHLIGFSQGGLVSRGILQKFSHNVDTFISISSPLAGEFGLPFMEEFQENITLEAISMLAYTSLGQQISLANYWNDPHMQDLYRNYSAFLAVYNNATYNPRSHEFKNNFLRLKQMVMIGGPDDGVIIPWQSSQFGFYDEKENTRDMTETKIYIEDTFGLRTLDKKGRLVFYTHPGVHHTHWLKTREVFDKYILPHLT